MLSKVKLVGILGAAVLVLAACNGSQAEPAELDVPEIDISVYQGADVLGGEQVRLRDVLAQGNPVVLNMWAGLCPVCRLEMPELQTAYDLYEGQVTIIGLDIGPFVQLGTEEDALAMIDELQITFPTGTTADSDVVWEYEVFGVPAVYFITPQGEIVDRHFGVLTADELNERIEDLLRASR